jgi:CubicO group peptidase (beta-lactamase class C family)
MSIRGISKARLGRTREIMAGYVERGATPGLVSLVSRGGEAHVDSLGVKALGGTSPVERDTIFRISSMTKPITAVATLVLIEECKLRLDDAVDRWLPELANPKVLKRVDGPLEDTEPAHRPISVRDLLTFRLGAGMLFGSPEQMPILRAIAEAGFAPGPPQPAHPPAPDEWLRRFASLPLAYQPGDRWMYHAGSELLGILIARASGKPFDVFLRERVFEPLGMKDTAFSVPADKLDRFTDSYLTAPDSGALQPYDAADGGQWSRPPAFPSGAGGLVSTIDDYHAFARMLLQGGKLGKTRILARPSVELMTSDHLTQAQKARSVLMPGDFENYGFGFGVSVITRRDQIHENVGQYGWDGGLGSTWRNDPREDLVTILLTQAAWTSPKLPLVSVDFLSSTYQALDD